MAYISQDEKKTIENRIKPILKEYGIRGTFSVYNKMELVLTLWEGPIDFVSNFNETMQDRSWERFEPVTEGYFTINEYHYYEREFSGIALEFLQKVIPAMKTDDWYCNDDIQSGYFDRKYYYSVKVGKWDKPYVVKNTTKTVPAAIQATPNEENEVSENMYSTMTNNEMIEQLVAMGPVIDSAIDLAPTFDVSSMVKQLTDMIEQMESEISFRMSQYQTAE